MPRGIWFARAGAALLASTAAVTTLAAPANAASVGTVRVAEFDAVDRVEFRAGSGKANRLVITWSGNKITLDDRYRIKPGKGCRTVKGDSTKVRCTVTEPADDSEENYLYAVLGDKNDVFHNKSDKHAIAYGGKGDDVLYGGSVQDAFSGGSGADKLFGGTGDDYMAGESGNDVLRGGLGDDVTEGGTGRDYLNGGEGGDLIFPDGGNDNVYAGDGDDRVFESTGNDTVDAGLGDDTVEGGPGDDVAYGDAGADKLYGGLGRDKLYGDDGDDLLNGSRARMNGTVYDTVADLLDGGAHTAGDTAEIVSGDTTAGCEKIVTVG
ncbi:calcium-binding protein [Actinoplanes sp. NPDC049802]|uniref:calcium-binding protein n=1 Tax=Actinoplanes sp. NPDC049802 TaxID=3154742 RepID=UPI0033E4D65D